MTVMRTNVLLLVTALAAAGEVQVPITNPLNLDWPWELVHRDLPAGSLPAPAIAAGMGDPRPVQLETLSDGRQRAWFNATVARNKDRDSTVPSRAEVTLTAGTAPTTLSVTESVDHLEIANGILRLKLARFTGAFPSPKKLSDLPPPLIACQMEGDSVIPQCLGD